MARDLKSARQWLKESDAVLLSYKIVSSTGYEEILRGWTNIPNGKGDICKEYLVSFSSAKNNVATLFVADPEIDKEEWYGTWKSFFSGWQYWQGKKYITQTIRKGYYRNIAFQNSRVSGGSTVQTRQQLGLTSETLEPVVSAAGVIKSQQVDVNHNDGSLNVRTDKDAGTSQTKKTQVITGARTVATTEKSVQESELVDPTSTPGIIKRVVNEDSEYPNRYNTTEENDTGTAQTRKTQIIAGNESIVITEKSVQESELADPAATPGVIKRVVNGDSEYPDRHDTTEDDNTGTPQTSTIKTASPSGISTTTIKTVQALALSDPASEKGHVKRVEDRASRYPERHDTVEDDEVPTDQESTAYEVSKAGKSTKVSHTEKATSLDEPTPTQGTIVRQSSQRTKAGNEQTLEDTFVPTDQESSDGADTGFVATARTTHTENPDTPTVADSTVGTRKSLEARKTEAGNLHTRESTETSKHKSVTEFVSKYSERETEYLSEEYYDHEPPEITDETGDGVDTAVVSHHFDDFLTHHYKVVRTVRKFSFDVEVSWVTRGDVQYETIQTYSETLGRYWNSSTKLFRWKQTHYLKFFKTAAEAAAYITSTSGAGWHNDGSRPVHTGLHEWLGHKVNRSKGYFHTYEYEEPVD